MTRTHPNRSPDTLISLVILSSMWQFAAFLTSRQLGELYSESTKPQRLYGERGLLQGIDFVKIIKSPWLSGRASKYGIRSSDVRFLKIFFVPRSWQNEKHIFLTMWVRVYFYSRQFKFRLTVAEGHGKRGESESNLWSVYLWIYKENYLLR